MKLPVESTAMPVGRLKVAALPTPLETPDENGPAPASVVTEAEVMTILRTALL
jgi:hypothetical protein